MLARGRSVVSAWWVGWWCWNIPSSSSWADCDRDKLTGSRKEVSPRCRIRPIPQCLLSSMPKFNPAKGLLKEPPACKRPCLKCPGLLLDRGAWSQSCCGGKDPPPQQALQGCLGQLERPVSIQAAWGWVCLPICLLFSLAEWLSCQPSHASVLVSHQQEASLWASYESFCQPEGQQLAGSAQGENSALPSSGTSKGKYQIH